MFAVVGLTIGMVVLAGSVLGGVALARNHSSNQNEVPVGNNAPANADDPSEDQSQSPGDDAQGDDNDEQGTSSNTQGKNDDADDDSDDSSPGGASMTPMPSTSPTGHETEGPDDDPSDD
jgi:hypothetical protein